jgi:MFS family permease
MSMINGARKQVFITFAPWVLITIFHRGPSTFAALAIVAAVFGIFLQPALGGLIDRLGERRILMMEGVFLFIVCIGYGFAHRISTGGAVIAIVYACFVLDNLLFSVGMARVTYVNKIADKPEDVTATLSLGVTLDHVISMSIPILGGATWVIYGFEYVFAGAAVLAFFSTFIASFVKVPAVTLQTPIVVTEEEGRGTCRTEEINR